MTDTVNARERVEAFLKEWARRGVTAGNGDILYSLGMSDGTLDLTMTDVRAMIAAAPKAEPVSDPYKLGDGEVLQWVDGYPEKFRSGEWFIAITAWNDRVCLKALPEEYSYDFTTADGTYIKADKIVKWMPFPDSEYRYPAQPEAPKVEQEPSVRRTMTVDLSDVEMAALDDLIAKKDLSGPNVFRQALKLYQAVENGAASVTWFTKYHPAPASDELLEALEPICREADCWPELTDDDVLSFATPEGSASPYDIKMGDIRRIAAIAKHKGPQS